MRRELRGVEVSILTERSNESNASSKAFIVFFRSNGKWNEIERGSLDIGPWRQKEIEAGPKPLPNIKEKSRDPSTKNDFTMNICTCPFM